MKDREILFLCVNRLLHVTIIILMILTLIQFADLYNKNLLTIDQFIQWNDLLNMDRPVPILIMVIIIKILTDLLEEYIIIRYPKKEKK